jgi:decaprenylphospho-beta-D-erythro-pentofuranosid-2-ulose 2-reductase
VVVGASSGIGEAIARQLAAGGSRVALVARSEDKLQRICVELNLHSEPPRALAFQHDVRRTADARSLFQQITTELGGLDLVVFCSGRMPDVAVDQFPTAEDMATIDTNFAGAVAWLNEAAVRFARAGSGTIVGISSVAGDRGRQKNPVYSATKAALNVYLESLRNRLARKGVTVLTVKPGYVRTPLIEGLQLPGLFPVIGPEQAAAEILRAAASGKRVVYVPAWWRAIMLVITAIPARVFERLSI